MTPDVVTLVGAGHQAGVDLRRRRRLQAGGGALAAVLLVGATFYATGDLLQERAAGPTDNGPDGVEQRVDATPRGMAAAVIQSFGLGTPLVVAGEEPKDPSASGRSLQVGIGYALAGQRVELDAIANADLSQWQASMTCDELGSPRNETVSCDDSALPDGTPAFNLVMRYVDQTGHGDPTTSYLAVAAVRRTDQLVAVTESVQVSNGDPGYTADTMPVPMVLLRQVASDPLVGLSTTQALNTQGEDLKDFKNSLVTTDSGSASSATVEPAPSYPAPTVEKAPATPAN